MNESFVAIGRGSLYSESRGKKVMADGISSQEAGRSSETRPKKQVEEKRRETEKAKREKATDATDKGSLERLREKLEKQVRGTTFVREESTPKENLFPQQTSEVVYEEEIPLGSGDIKFKAAIYRRKDGSYVMNRLPTNKYDEETIKKLFKKAGIDEDFQFPKNWEKLSTEEKIRYLEANGIDSLEYAVNIMPAWFGGQGASFRNLILERWENLGQPITPQIQAIDAEIASRAQSQDPGLLLSVERDLREIRDTIRGNAILEAELDQVLPPNLQQQISNAKGQMDARYNNILAGLGAAARRGSVGDIDDIAGSELQAVRQGYHDVGYGIQRVLATAAGRGDIPVHDGLRMWHAFQKLEQIVEAYEVYTKTQVSPDPLINIQNAEVVMRFFEKSRTQEAFGLARERLIQLLQAVTLSTDLRVTAHLKEVFRKRIESFEAVNMLLIVMDSTEGDPEQMDSVAHRLFTNDTWHYYYERFNPEDLRDENGNYYMVDANGNRLDINILSEVENAFIYQYLVDRFRVNQVQDMMLRDLNVGSANDYERWIIRRILNLQPNFNLANLTTQQIDNLRNLWADDRVKEGVVRQWYAEETWMGADGYGIDPQTGMQVRRVELWQDRIMQGGLRDRVINAGVRQDRINALLGNYDLISALKRNGFDLAKFKFADTLDRFEIFSRSGEHINTIFGEETPYSAHIVSHFVDFALNETQGDPRVNAAVFAKFREQWDGFRQHHSAFEGFLLPQNLTAFRVLAQSNRHLLPGNLRKHLGNRIAREMTRRGVEEREVDGYVYAQELFRGIDPDNPSIVNEFANINWGEASREMKSYDLGDMLDDRMNTLKWFMGKWRAWLLHPTDKEFFEMMEDYYSKRNVRRHPGSADFLEIEWAVGQHWREWFGYKEDITNAVMEGFIQQSEELSLVDRGRGERLKNRLLGREPFRSSRQITAMGRRSVRETLLSPGWWFGNVWDFLKTLFGYLVPGK